MYECNRVCLYACIYVQIYECHALCVIYMYASLFAYETGLQEDANPANTRSRVAATRRVACFIRREGEDDYRTITVVVTIKQSNILLRNNWRSTSADCHSWLWSRRNFVRYVPGASWLLQRHRVRAQYIRWYLMS